MTFITLWDCRLNEDTANCRAKQFGMNEKNAGAVSCQKKKRGGGGRKVPIASLISQLPPPPSLFFFAAGVHLVSINHGLLTAERQSLSHQHVIR